MLRGEHHFEADVDGSINDGAARRADELEAAGVFGAITAGEADDMNYVAAAKFGSTAEGRVVKIADRGIDVRRRNGMVQIDPAQGLTQTVVEEGRIELSLVKSSQNARARGSR